MTAADDTSITLGEVGRRLTRLEDTLTIIGSRIENLAFVRQDVWRAERQKLEQTIGQLETETIANLKNDLMAKADKVAFDQLRANLNRLVFLLLTAGVGGVATLILAAVTK